MKKAASKPSRPSAATAGKKPQPGSPPSPKVHARRAAKLPFSRNEYVVYPAHGVGRIVKIEEQTIANNQMELFVVGFDKEKMTLRVPTHRAEQVGLRKLSDRKVLTQATRTLRGKARVRRTMWSRRAQEYESKINSGNLVAVAEVVRDLFRAEHQPEQSYSERQIYEAALQRMAREVAAIEGIDDEDAVSKLETTLRKAPGREKPPPPPTTTPTTTSR